MIASASTSPMRGVLPRHESRRAGTVDFVSDDVGFAVGAEEQVDVIVLTQGANKNRRETFGSVRPSVSLARLHCGRLDGSRRRAFIVPTIDPRHAIVICGVRFDPVVDPTAEVEHRPIDGRRAGDPIDEVQQAWPKVGRRAAVDAVIADASREAGRGRSTSMRPPCRRAVPRQAPSGTQAPAAAMPIGLS